MTGERPVKPVKYHSLRTHIVHRPPDQLVEQMATNNPPFAVKGSEVLPAEQEGSS